MKTMNANSNRFSPKTVEVRVGFIAIVEGFGDTVVIGR